MYMVEALRKLTSMVEQQTSGTENNSAQPVKKSKGKIIALVVGSILVVCCVVGAIAGVGGYFFYGIVKAPVKPIKAQLEALNNSNIREAYYDHTSKGFRDKTNYDDFVKFVESYPQIFKSKSSSFNSVNIDGTEALVKGSITGKDGTETNMAYKVVKENGKWLIYGLETQ